MIDESNTWVPVPDRAGFENPFTGEVIYYEEYHRRGAPKPHPAIEKMYKESFAGRHLWERMRKFSEALNMGEGAYYIPDMLDKAVNALNRLKGLDK